MIYVILMFALLFGAFWIGIPALRNLTGLEKWKLTKTVAYAILCAVLTLLVLAGFVILF
jgi:hypothetical protein